MAKPFAKALLLGLFVIIIVGFNKQNNSLEHNTLLNALKSLNQYHHEPFGDSNEHSKRIFHLFLRQLDFKKQLFTQKEIDLLKTHEELIDNQLSEQNFESMLLFFAEALGQHKIALDRAEGIVDELLSSHAFDYAKDETINLDYESRGYAANEEALKERWRKSLKMLLMNEMANHVLAFEPDAGLVQGATEKVKQNMRRYFGRERNATERRRFDQYLGAMAMAYDPNTRYNPPIDAAQSLKRIDIIESLIRGVLGGQENAPQGIGVAIVHKGGYVRIAKVIAGGPAHKHGGLKVGDALVKIGQANEDPVIAVGMSASEVAKRLLGPKGTVVHLTVQRGDEIVRASIERGAIDRLPSGRTTQRYASSLVLRLAISPEQSFQSFGYLRLPSFYDETGPGERAWGGGIRRRAAEDVEKELLKLIEQKVKGIALDLRNNQGGRATEAADIVGLFVGTEPPKQQPAAVFRHRYGTNKLVPLNFGGTTVKPPLPYKGPLVVMVNEASASGSELLSAALQDYNRAVIVGSKTHGKGTGSDAFPTPVSNQELGSFDITTIKFYRVTGDTTQYKGVAPDIVFPTTLEMTGTWTARKHLYPMEPDSIGPLQYVPLSNVTDGVREQLRRKHKERTDNNPYFAFLRSNQAAFEAWFAARRVPLERSKYFEHKDRLEKWREALNAIALNNEQAMSMSMEQDDWPEKLEQDMELREAIRVLGDLATTSASAATPAEPN